MFFNFFSVAGKPRDAALIFIDTECAVYYIKFYLIKCN